MLPDSKLAKLVAVLERLGAGSSTGPGLNDFLHAVLRVFGDEMGYESCAAALIDERNPDTLVVRAASGLLAASDGTSAPVGGRACGEALRTGEVVLVPRGVASFRTAAGPRALGSELHLPLTAHGRTIGVLTIFEPKPGALWAADLTLMRTLSRYLATPLEVVCHIDHQLKAIVDADPLVELSGRVTAIEVAHLHAFADRIAGEIERSRRRGAGFTVAHLEVDGIDGGPGGSRENLAIQRVAEVLADGIGAFDLAVRYGGDAFLLLFPDTTARQTEAVLASMDLDRLALDGPERQAAALNVSWGVAAWPQDGAGPDDLLRAAERHLHRAKHVGVLEGVGDDAASAAGPAARPARELSMSTWRSAAISAAAVTLGAAVFVAAGTSLWQRAVPPHRQAERVYTAQVSGAPPALAVPVPAARISPSPAVAPAAATRRRPHRATAAAARRVPPAQARRFLVVAGPMPTPVAVRRVAALAAMGVHAAPSIKPVGLDRALVYYGTFGSREDAQSLARHVRTVGYTASIVAETASTSFSLPGAAR